VCRELWVTLTACVLGPSRIFIFTRCSSTASSYAPVASDVNLGTRTVPKRQTLYRSVAQIEPADTDYRGDARLGTIPCSAKSVGLASRVAARVAERVQRLPAWAQPMAAGALLFVGYGLFKLIFLLPAIMRSPVKGALTALMGIALSGSIGAAPGFLYGQHRRLRERRSGRRTALTAGLGAHRVLERSSLSRAL
jgi:hypothetical protein